MALKLAVDNTSLIATEPHTRPIRIFYYRSPRDTLDDASMISRAKTLRGAVRAAVLRVLFDDFGMVQIYHEEGYFLASIKIERRHGKNRLVRIEGFFEAV